MTGAPVHKLDLPAASSRSDPSAAAVERLTLNAFRCYEFVRLETDGRSVVLTGPNGAGKTNVLEAVSLLSPGRGLRRATLGELPRRADGHADNRDAATWAVAARVTTVAGLVEIGTGVAAGEDKRAVRIDGQTARGQSELANRLGVQWLTPAMDRLFVEGRSGRRRFLDRLVYAIDPAHAGRITAYEHALRERARLLRGGIGDDAWLGALEDTLAAKGVAVAAARLDLLARLNGYCDRDEGPFPGAGLAVDGAVEGWLADHAAVDAEDRLRAALSASRSRDADAGGSAVGPHRSDFKVRHLPSGRTADLCSTGEQKALLIAIVLAGARMAAAESGRLPVLLLDEVSAHLDIERRAALFALLGELGAQVWMTGTEPALFDGLADGARFFDVADAAVTPAD